MGIWSRKISHLIFPMDVSKWAIGLGIAAAAARVRGGGSEMRMRVGRGRGTIKRVTRGRYDMYRYVVHRRGVRYNVHGLSHLSHTKLWRAGHTFFRGAGVESVSHGGTCGCQQVGE